MDLSPYVAAVRDDLTAAASVGDESTARAGTALAAALEPAVRLAVMTALSDLTTEVSGALGDRTVGLRLEGREVRVVVDGGEPETDRATGGPAAPEDPDASGGFFAGPTSSPFGEPHPFGRSGGPFGPGFGRPGAGGPDVGDISRMTLRLVDQIKGQAEQAAAARGMSLNSWIGQAVQGALRDAGAAGGWAGKWTEPRPGTDQAGERPTPPTPDAPTPDAPTPDAPTPGTSTPDGPTPGPSTPDEDR